jgi:signal peptidase I
MPFNLSSDETISLFEDILGRDLILRVKVTGKSMSPVLRGGEILTIQKVPSSSLHIGDLIFYKTREGFPLLHRLVRRQRERDRFLFQTKGDALIAIDEPVTEDNILGKVCGIEEKLAPGKTNHINMESQYRRIINYLLAKKSLMKSKAYLSIQQCPLYPSLRSIVKKTII